MDKQSHHIPAEVRAAISAFLIACQEEARPFATSQALDAVRRVFPDLDISDDDLMDAIISEASMAGFDVTSPDAASRFANRNSLEEWDNEGGAIAGPTRTKAQQRAIDNDTDGTRRRARENHDRNTLL